jgi:hypothetical protein
MKRSLAIALSFAAMFSVDAAAQANSKKKAKTNKIARRLEMCARPESDCTGVASDLLPLVKCRSPVCG